MKIIETNKVSKPIGHYSHAVKTGNLVFCSGRTPVNPATGKIDTNDIPQQTKFCLENIRLILSEAGLTLNNVVKVSVFLADMDMFQEMNQAYSEVFGNHKPARTTIAAKGLPLNTLVEIDCIAAIE